MARVVGARLIHDWRAVPIGAYDARFFRWNDDRLVELCRSLGKCSPTETVCSIRVDENGVELVFVAKEAATRPL